MLAGGAVPWISTNETMGALLTSGAEYSALSAAGRESIWLKGIETVLDVYTSGPMLVWGIIQAPW